MRILDTVEQSLLAGAVLAVLGTWTTGVGAGPPPSGGGEPRPADARTPQRPPESRSGAWAEPGRARNNRPVSQAADSNPLVDPQEQKPSKKDRPDSRKAPVRIAAIGNKLLISSDDPEALALASSLVRLLSQTPTGEGDFEIIRLKNASATDAAKALDEVFNGPKETTNQQQGFNPFLARFGGGRGAGFGGPGFGGPGAGGPGAGGPGGRGTEGAGAGGAGAGAGQPSKPATPRIRVVAYPPTNSLLVQASPMDMLSIRRLLDNALDTGESDSNGLIRTWVVGPLRNARAEDVALVIKDVYREQINNNPSPNQPGGFRRFGPPGFAQNQNLDASGNPRAVTLSVGVDDRTNSLVLACPATMYEDIKKLATRLDDAANTSNRAVRVISVKGIDPSLVQDMVDAVQGRTPTSRSRNGTTGTTGGFGSPTAGAFMPGGFPAGFPTGGSPGFFPGGGARGFFQGGGPRGGAPGGGGLGGGRPGR